MQAEHKRTNATGTALVLFYQRWYDKRLSIKEMRLLWARISAVHTELGIQAKS